MHTQYINHNYLREHWLLVLGRQSPLEFATAHVVSKYDYRAIASVEAHQVVRDWLTLQLANGA